MNAIAYIRFSTDDQSKGTSIERQQENIEAYASRNGLVVAETLIDDGFSASKGEHLSHGKLGRFLAEADQGKYKALPSLLSGLIDSPGSGLTRPQSYYVASCRLRSSFTSRRKIERSDRWMI